MPHGIIHGMELRIDHAGRIVIPKPLRERLGFSPETVLEAIEQPPGVLIRRAEEKPAMRLEGGLWVHYGGDPGLDWDQVVDDAREDRIQDLLRIR